MQAEGLIVLSAAILVQIFKLYKSNQKLKNLFKTLNTIIDITPLSVSQLINKLESNSISESTEICKGKIFAGEQCSAVLNQKIPIVFSRLQNKQMSNIKMNSHRFLRTKEPSFAKLKDQNSVINIFQTNATSIVTTHHLENIRPGIYEKVKGFMKTVFNILSVFERRGQLNHSLFDDDQIRQSYLPEGADCTVFGLFTKESSGVVCYSPKWITPNKPRMIALIQQKQFKQRILTLFLILGTIACILLLLRELWKIGKRYKKKSEDILYSIEKLFVKSRVCRICHRNLSSIINKSCLHMNLCQSCYQAKPSNCLDCNKKIKEVIQLYDC